MKYIKGITFAPFARKGTLKSNEAFRSLELLVENTNADFIILAPQALQENPHSEIIEYHNPHCATDDEWYGIIDHAKKLGLRVAIKPTVNCMDGTWRAHINFFDKDVHCEPKWSNWFKSYTEFQLHFAKMAQATGCDMFIAGCEMVQTERRVDEWRKLLSDIKEVFKGPVSYNTDKYQEDNVGFWDAVDVISSSGYYPSGDISNQLDRIEKVVKEHNKPFFFAECGCMSSKHSSEIPNDWTRGNVPDTKEQADWYREFFAECGKRDWVEGFAFWDWPAKLYAPEDAEKDNGYNMYAKEAEKVIKENYSK